MTDQEQTERGTSTAIDEWDAYRARQRSIGHYYPSESTTFFAGWWARDRQLEAERDAMREVVDLAREYMDALRREQREVLGDDDAEVEAMLDAMCGDDEGSREVQVKRRALIARLNATRKATADAAEGK